MSQPKTMKVATRLVAESRRPGGVTVSEALKRADAALEVLRGPCLASIDESLEEMEARFGPAAERSAASFKELYRLASGIVDASIFLSHTDLDKAARALCQLTALCEANATWDWVAVDLHITTLRLLRVTGVSLSAAQRQAVIKGLNQV